MPSAARTKCHYCDKACKSALGIRRHLQTCRALSQQSQRTVIHTSNFRIERPLSNSPSQRSYSSQPEVRQTIRQGVTCQPECLLPEGDPLLNGEDVNIEVSSSASACKPNITLEDHPASDIPLGNAESASTVPTSIRQGRRVKTAVATRVRYSDSSIAGKDGFGKRAGRPAGKALEESRQTFTETALGRAKLRKDSGQFTGLNDEDFYPFKSQSEYAMVDWFLSYKLSKGAIDDFLKNDSLSSQREGLSFRNADELLDQVHNIPYGISEYVDEEWKSTMLEVQSEYEGETIQCDVLYRSVEDVIRFLIGFPPFAQHLHYCPERHFDDEGQRIYSEMYTANWWWRTQHLIDAPDATVVPVLIASDKTQLSMHHGDQKAWAVYLTIGNLDRAVRLKYSIPSLILVGLLPIVPQLNNSHDGLKMELYHRAMDIIFRPLKQLAHDGAIMFCADGQLRRCFPIIAGFLADYEEQVIITCVKMNQQCPICYVPRDQREHLYTAKPWPRRLHSRTLEMMQKQPDGGGFRNVHMSREDMSFWSREPDPYTRDDQEGYAHALDVKEEHNRVHPIHNFVWGHPFADVHQSILPDILHQVLKGLIMMLITNVKSAVQGGSSLIPTQRKRANERRTLAQAPARELLDRRFQAVPPFPGLRVFPSFSNIAQWTGDEQRMIVRQIIPVITPLFRDHKPEYILLARAIVDFYLLANSPVHTEGILRYIDDAIYRIDLLKWAYNAERMKDSRRADEPHYNIPKMHQITHYTDQIRLFGSVDGFSTNRPEVGHKDEIKAFYPRTNKNDYLLQLVRHNTRRVNWMAMSCYIQWLGSNKETQAERQLAQFEGATPCEKFVDLSVLGVRFSAKDVDHAPKPHKFWSRAVDIQPVLAVPELLAALGTFVRQQRDRRNGISLTNIELDRYDSDTGWASKLWVGLHNRLRCPKPAGKDHTNMDDTTDDLIYAALRYRGKEKKSRHDHVWVQEFGSGEPDEVATQGHSASVNTTGMRVATQGHSASVDFSDTQAATQGHSASVNTTGMRVATQGHSASVDFSDTQAVTQGHSASVDFSDTQAVTQGHSASVDFSDTQAATQGHSASVDFSDTRAATQGHSASVNITSTRAASRRKKRSCEAVATTTDLRDRNVATSKSAKRPRHVQSLTGTAQARDAAVLSANSATSARLPGALLFDGRRIGKVLAIMTIEDPLYEDDDTGQRIRYTAVLVELLQFRNSGRYDPIHGMIEVQHYLPTDSPTIAKKRFYTLDTILRSAHVVPGLQVTASQRLVLMVNPFVDWDQYNTLYDPDFLDENRRAAEEMFNKRGWRRFMGSHKPLYRPIEPWISGE